MIDYYEGHIKLVEDIQSDVDVLCCEFETSVKRKLMDYHLLKGASEYFINSKELILLPETYNLSQDIKTFFNFTDICYRVVPALSTYLWHTDPEQVCVHVPLTTNPGCWFVYEGVSFHLPAEGKAYVVNNDKPHTFVNSGSTERVHMIFMKKHNGIALKLKNKFNF